MSFCRLNRLHRSSVFYALRSRTIFTVAPARPPSRPTSSPFSQPALGVNPAYDAAISLLKDEQSQLQKEIEELKKQTENSKNAETLKLLEAKEIELQYTFLETHYKFHEQLAPVTEPVYADMHRQRYYNYVVPELQKKSELHGLPGDVYPTFMKPKHIMELNFSYTKWLGPCGHSVRPSEALYSPEIIITTGSNETKHFTLLMMDLDRENPEKGAYDEFCHWLITDIPVNNRLVIPGGSTLLTTKFAVGEPNHSNHAPPPKEENPVLPGNVLVPYMPPHPAYSDPRNLHRYVFTLFEQPSEKLKVNVEDITTTWKFKTEHNLEVASFGFFVSTWDVFTSRIFTALGIEEPVYAPQPKSTNHMLEKIQNGITIASSHKNLFGRLGRRDNYTTSYTVPKTYSNDTSDDGPVKWDVYTNLIQGKKLPLPKLVVPTQYSLKMDKEPKNIKFEEAEWMRNKHGKTPRLSRFAAAALVKSKFGGGPETVVGKDRFLNA